jgi:2-iminobutanoate/2-iminopropanoate deaminase
MQKAVITTDRIAAPVGPFSQAIRAGDTVYLSGQVAQDPVTGKLIDADVTRQTEQILKNVDAVLQAGGLNLRDVVKVGVFLADMGDFQPMNAVYARWFEPPYPARTTVAVAALPLGALVEIDVIARGH